MLDKVEMSLDDIIKKDKSLRNAGRGRGRGQFRRGGRGGGGVSRVNARGGVTPLRNRRGGGGRFSTGPRTNFARSPGDIDSRWQHDMYDGPARMRRGGGGVGGGMGLSGGPTKLVVSNLDYGVSNSDIQELFTEFGPIKSASVNYDKSGRSMGSANVVFERRSDAVKALKQYNGVPLDGRPMNIELTTSDVSVFQTNRMGGGGFRRQGGRGNRMGGGGRGRGRGGGGDFRRGRGGGRGGRKKENLTAAELDAQLDEYISKSTDG